MQQKYQPIDPEGAQRGPESEGMEKLNAIVARLDSLATEQVSKKTSIEDRWFNDLQRYHGRYDAQVEERLKAAGKSRLFVNLTRAKTNAWEARLSDMLFPTDDKNWGIDPTPVPDLVNPPEDAKVRDPIAFAKLLRDEAAQAAQEMQTEIEDQLTECRYNIECRDVIHDACKLGTGVIKGPVANENNTRYWGFDTEAGGFALMERPDPAPGATRVDPWNFFPDMSARTIAESEFTFERHLLNRAEMKKLAKKPGFLKDEIRNALRDKPREGLPKYLNLLRSITENDQQGMDDRYHVWEYRGPLETEDLIALCECYADDPGTEDIVNALADDPLVDIHAVVFFVNGRIIKFGLHTLDSNETIYSVFCLEKDDTSIFGFGIPYLMEAPQAAVNGAWRMIMDHGDLTVGPQIEINQDILEPVDGRWSLHGRKLWRRKKSVNPNEPGIVIHDIPSRLGDLRSVIEQARDFAEEETSLPMIAQGEQGAEITKTAQGMSLLMNSANVVFRRVVKNFDDDLTTPIIRRFYDWNMQFNPRDEIKGDFQVKARGSSVLLTAEMQSQNLMVLADRLTAHPVLGVGLKGLNVLRRLVQSMHLSADDLVMTDEEMEEQAAAAQEEAPPPDPNVIRAEMDMKLAEMKMTFESQENERKREHEMLMRDREHDIQMMKLAQDSNVALDKIHADLEKTRATTASKERLFAAEAGLKARHGEGI